MWNEFKEFAFRGNVVDLAIGFIMGAAFSPIAKSLVDDVIMPPIGLLLGDVQFQDMFWLLRAGDPSPPYATLEQAREAGAVAISYGVFVNTLVTFFIVAFAVFLLVKAVNRARRKEEGAAPDEPTTKTCPHCLSTIPIRATKCAYCTTGLEAPAS